MEERFTTFGEVALYLDKLPKFSTAGVAAARMGLERMEQFSRRMDAPQRKVPMVHVAGTNGKGTTCRMLASIFQEAGYRTGLYTSPHLIRLNERVRVDARPVPNASILEFFRRYDRDLQEVPLTYFEITTCLAFWYFAETSCDIAMIETGLGGRLDATNLIDPIVSVITSVSEDHTDLLGTSIASIAAEKAGIIKPNRPVVAGQLSGTAESVIRQRATECRSPLIFCRTFKPEWQNGNILLREPGEGRTFRIDGSGRKAVDRYNAAMALGVLCQLQERFPSALPQLEAGLASMDERFPEHGTFQRLDPVRNWFFDGAHNRESVATLLEELEHRYKDREPVIVLSMMKDKAVPELLEKFRPYHYVYYIDNGTERSADCNQIKKAIPHVRCMKSTDPAAVSILESLKSELVIFTGSFYFYHQVKHWIASPPPSDQTNSSGSGS